MPHLHRTPDSLAFVCRCAGRQYARAKMAQKRVSAIVNGTLEPTPLERAGGSSGGAADGLPSGPPPSLDEELRRSKVLREQIAAMLGNAK